MKHGWQLKRLGEVCEFDKRQGYYSGLPYVGMEDIEPNNAKFIGDIVPKNVKSSTFKFEKEYVLFGRLRPYLCKVIVSAFEGHCSTEIYPIKPSSELNAYFLKYWIMQDAIIEMINETCTGARMPRANMNQFLNFEIPLPPLSEQQRIVEKLDRAFAKIEDLRKTAEENLQEARRLFDASLRFELSAKEGWETVFLPQISKNLDSQRIPITKCNRKMGIYPYYGASGIVDYVDDFLFDDYLLLISEDGANLLARTTPIAFSVSGKAWVNNHAHVIKFDNISTHKYVEKYFEFIRVDEFVTGAAQPKLNQKALNSILINIPNNVPEQQRIVEKLDMISDRCLQMEENYKQTISLCNDLKQSLLRKTFNGEL
ncbi:MAG: restriction endonuclease subunit S [Tannerellaceae bacterium]